jgi:hypothetical protein
LEALLIILFVPFNHFNDFQIGGNIMGKYLVLWEVDQTKIPIDPKERGDGWGFLMAMIRKDIEKGLTKDWGSFLGETRGYAVNEGTEVEVMNALQQYVPFCIFKVHPIATETQANEMIKALSG